jgi:hypothetical protein
MVPQTSQKVHLSHDYIDPLLTLLSHLQSSKRRDHTPDLERPTSHERTIPVGSRSYQQRRSGSTHLKPRIRHCFHIKANNSNISSRDFDSSPNSISTVLMGRQCCLEIDLCTRGPIPATGIMEAAI